MKVSKKVNAVIAIFEENDFQVYRDAFRITESVKDFEEYHTRLKDVLEQLNAAEKPGRKK